MTPWPPIEPPRSRARFPDPAELGEEWVVGVTRSLDPGTVLAAYRQGIFPWPSRPGKVPWASPEPRAVFPLAQAGEWPRTVRRALAAADKQGWTVSFDEAYAEVMRACGTRPGEGTWITPDLFDTYLELHRLGWGHSVEVWAPLAPDEAADPAERERGRRLVGGLYGLGVGALFAGESMFHRETGGSKVAFARMAERLRQQGFELFDVQVMTEHLRLLGCVEVRRAAYLKQVKKAALRPVRFHPAA